MDRTRIFQNAVAAVRAEIQDGSIAHQQWSEQARAEAQAAGFTGQQIHDAARGFSNDNLIDYS